MRAFAVLVAFSLVVGGTWWDQLTWQQVAVLGIVGVTSCVALWADSMEARVRAVIKATDRAKAEEEL